MATSAIPEILDTLVQLAKDTLDDVIITDGIGPSDEVGKYLMIGVDDVDGDSYFPSADSRQSWANIGHVARDEVGDVTCAAMAWNGQNDPKQARADVFGLIGDLEDAIRADPTLGIRPQVRAEFGTSVQLRQLQDEYGASATVVFQIHFEVRI